MTDESLAKKAAASLLFALCMFVGAYLVLATAALGAPPPREDVPGNPPTNGRDGFRSEPPPRPEHPALKLFDTDGDQRLSPTEIANMSAVLLTFDFNLDGSLDLEELIEALPPPRGPEHRRGGGERRGLPPPPAGMSE